MSRRGEIQSDVNPDESPGIVALLRIFRPSSQVVIREYSLLIRTEYSAQSVGDSHRNQIICSLRWLSLSGFGL